MDIEVLKGKLSESEYESLTGYVAGLVAKQDEAQRRSEEGRLKFKKLADEADSLRKLRDDLFEKLGIESADEIDALKTASGQAEATKQFEAKIKRMERELAERTDSLQKISDARRADQQTAQLAKAMQGHEWNDAEVVESFISSRIIWEDDQPFYRAGDGKLVSIGEGVALFANEKPALLKSRGAGGSGYSKGANGSTLPGGNEGQAQTLDVSAIYAARQPQSS